MTNEQSFYAMTPDWLIRDIKIAKPMEEQLQPAVYECLERPGITFDTDVLPESVSLLQMNETKHKKAEKQLTMHMLSSLIFYA